MPRRRALPTLDRMRALTALLGEPQDSIPSIHITGTNGKGSTSAMATSLLLAKGLSVGTYTSPNLHVVAERLARNGEAIDDESLTARADRAGAARVPARRAADALRAAHRGRPVVVRHRGGRRHGGRGGAGWHVGLHQRGARRRGGAHQRQLRPHRRPRPHPRGDRGGQGGHHRAGQPGRGGGDGPRAGRHRRRAGPAQVGAASVWVAGRDFGCESNRVAVGGRLVTLWTPGGRYEDVLVPLHGAHQGVERGRRHRRGGGVLRRPARPRGGRGGIGRRARAGPPRGAGASPAAAGRRRAQRGGHGRAGGRADRGVRGRRRVGGRGGDALGSGPVRHAGAAGVGGDHRDRRLRARLATRHAGRRGGRGGRAHSGWPSTRSPTCRAALRVAPRHGRRRRARRGRRIALRGGHGRADALASAVPWEDAGR